VVNTAVHRRFDGSSTNCAAPCRHWPTGPASRRRQVRRHHRGTENECGGTREHGLTQHARFDHGFPPWIILFGYDSTLFAQACNFNLSTVSRSLLGSTGYGSMGRYPWFGLCPSRAPALWRPARDHAPEAADDSKRTSGLRSRQHFATNTHACACTSWGLTLDFDWPTLYGR